MQNVSVNFSLPFLAANYRSNRTVFWEINAPMACLVPNQKKCGVIYCSGIPYSATIFEIMHARRSLSSPADMFLILKGATTSMTDKFANDDMALTVFLTTFVEVTWRR